MTENQKPGLSSPVRYVLLLFTILCVSVFPASDYSQLTAQETAEESSTEIDDSVQVRVRELVYILRHHHVFSREEEWGNAIRELATIGQPAVPELLRELENTKRAVALSGLYFTLRAIGDPMALPFLVDSIPKAEALSERGSVCALIFVNAELHRFLKQHEKWPSSSDNVTYGRPKDEILGTLHKLSGQKLPDLSKRVPHPTWETAYWQTWWNDQSDSQVPKSQAITLPSRDEDLVERDGTRRFGKPFPTGPDQYLSEPIDITLPSFRLAGAAGCLDIETGILYEYMEGVRYGPEKAYDKMDHPRWFDRNGIDLTVEDGHDLHAWQIDNDRWDSLDTEVRSDKPLSMGRDASMLTPFDEQSKEYKSDEIGTFLFTTGEGSQGVLRRYPYDRNTQTQRFQYRLWNRRVIKPHGSAESEQELADGTWGSLQVAILKEPGIGNKCLFDLNKGQGKTFPASIFAGSQVNEIDGLQLQGGLFRNDTIANWARNHQIHIASSTAWIIGSDNGNMPDVDMIIATEKTIGLTILDGRAVQVSSDLFRNLSVSHARDILARNPSEFRVASYSLTPPTRSGTSPATYLFETKTGLIGLIHIPDIGKQPASISFEYKLAEIKE